MKNHRQNLWKSGDHFSTLVLVMQDENKSSVNKDLSIKTVEFELKRVNGKLVPKDVDWKVDISETKIVADFYSCSPRNGVNGEFRHVN